MCGHGGRCGVITREQLVERIEKATIEAERTAKVAEEMRARSEAATPGGLIGYDPAILSGLRRKPNPKRDEARRNAYSREASAYRAAENAATEVTYLKATLKRLDAEPPAPTLEQIKAALYVRDRFGWHRIVKVNTKSVSVESGYSWTDRIALKDILEARP